MGIPSEAIKQEPREEGTYIPGTYEECEKMWLLVRTGLARIPYLQLASRHLDGPTKEMIVAVYRPRHSHADPLVVEADLMKVWETEIVDHASIIHTLSHREGALELRFALIEPAGYFVSGKITIEF